MAWIEVSADVETHPKTMTLQELLPLSDRETLGLLCSLWFYALRQADADGLMEGVTPGMLARILKTPQRETKEVEALISSGFLDKTEQGLRVHNWKQYSGKMLEAKLRNRERKKKQRAGGELKHDETEMSQGQGGDITGMSQGCHMDVTGTSHECHATDKRRVEEKRKEDIREEDIRKEDSLYGGEAAGAPEAHGTRKRVYSEAFETFWKQYPRKIAKPEAAKAFAKMVSPDDMDELMDGVNTWNYSEQWLRDNGRYIPHAATFLHREQWRDNPKLDRPDEEYRPPVVTTNF